MLTFPAMADEFRRITNMGFLIRYFLEHGDGHVVWKTDMHYTSVAAKVDENNC
jgi:hypothetical protein